MLFIEPLKTQYFQLMFWNGKTDMFPNIISHHTSLKLKTRDIVGQIVNFVSKASNTVHQRNRKFQYKGVVVALEFKSYPSSHWLEVKLNAFWRLAMWTNMKRDFNFGVLCFFEKMYEIFFNILLKSLKFCFKKFNGILFRNYATHPSKSYQVLQFWSI